jgi:hypothetical protein
MDQTFLQQQIEKRAEERLQAECRAIHEALKKTALGMRIMIGEKYLTRSAPNGYYRKEETAIFGNDGGTEIAGTNLKEVCEERREELIREETDKILSDLENIQYLFKNSEEQTDE